MRMERVVGRGISSCRIRRVGRGVPREVGWVKCGGWRD